MRRRPFICLLAAAALALAGTAPPGIAAPDGDGIAEIVAYLEQMTSLSADFEQLRYDEYDALVETAQGHCDILRPGRFRWIYREPYAQSIVSDGTTLWIYDEDLAQVTVNPVGAGGQGSPAELLGAEFAVLDRYVVERLADADDYRWFALTPKAPASDFQRVELGWKDGEVAAMRLKDNLGQTTRLTFSDLHRNVGMPDTVFAFTPPAGVDVIEGAAP